MAFDLYPRNKKLKPISFGALRWPVIMGEVGLVIGWRNYPDSLGWSVIPDDRGLSPDCNDGFYVRAEDARAISRCCETLISQDEFLKSEGREGLGDGLIEMAQKLRPFAHQSGGFWIK